MTSVKQKSPSARDVELTKYQHMCAELSTDLNNADEEIAQLRMELQAAWDDAEFLRRLSEQRLRRIERLTPKKKVAKKKAKRRG